MLNRLFRNRRALQLVAGVAALVLCSGQVLAELHLHEAAVADEFCSLCGFSDSNSAPAGVGAALAAQPRSNPDAPRPVSSNLPPRPFENSRTRAPPAS